MNILLADDHEIVRTGIKRILETHESISRIYEASDGKEALKIIYDNKPDLVVLDINMPHLSGLDILNRVNEDKLDVKFLILSMYPEKEYAIRALKNGAYGYITKDSAADELFNAIDAVLNGKRYVSKDLQDILFDFASKGTESDPHDRLSDREFKVFILLAEGKTIAEIADILFISNKTVSTYKSRVIEKMRISSVAKLTKYAIQHKLIS